MKGIIYEYRNVFNNKFYVGQTKYPEKRYNNHKKAKEDSVFHFAIRKYGFESFEYNVVTEYEAETEEQLNDLLNSAEVERIKYRNSLVPNGYNVAEGGNVGNFLAGFTDEQRAEFCKTQSINSKRYWETLDDDERQKQLQRLKEAGLIGAKCTWTNKKHHTDDARKKMSNARKGKYIGENNPMYGKSCTDFMTPEEIEQWKKNIGIKSKERFEDPDFRKAHRERSIGKNNGMYGKTHSNKSRAKMAKAAQGKHRVYHEDGTYHLER